MFESPELSKVFKDALLQTVLLAPTTATPAMRFRILSGEFSSSRAVKLPTACSDFGRESIPNWLADPNRLLCATHHGSWRIRRYDGQIW